MSVSVSRRHNGLFIAVRDGGPVLPGGAERHGLGPSLVDRIASTTLSTEDIATRLRIPVNTMRAPLKAIYRKLEVCSDRSRSRQARLGSSNGGKWRGRESSRRRGEQS
jgi:hypothetical protein